MTPTHQEKELRKEFEKEFGCIQGPVMGHTMSIADWWLEKRSQDLARLREKVEGMKIKYANGRTKPPQASPFNSALSAVLEMIDRETKND